jgi:hypothetical protein
LWGLLRLLDKTVEQYCLALLDRKQHAGNPAAIEISPNLKEPVAYRTAGGHADRPAEFDCPNIISNSLAILGTQATQPIADGLRSGRRLVKRGWQPFHLRGVPKVVQNSKRSPAAMWRCTRAAAAAPPASGTMTRCIIFQACSKSSDEN